MNNKTNEKQKFGDSCDPIYYRIDNNWDFSFNICAASKCPEPDWKYTSSSTITKSIKNNPSAGAANSNWTGSIQLSSTLSQTIESKVHISLSNAITVAEKTVGANSHATSGRLAAENGF